MNISVVYEGAVAVVTWDDGENRVNFDSLGRLNQILDELETRSGPLAIVLTGTGKFFSNGLDLARFGHEPDEFAGTLREFERTVGRLLLFPAYTVAAINGHAFAAGALLTCAFDYRLMREDRGYWCMNEAEIGLALDDRLWSILANRLPRATAIAAATTARRFGAAEALHHGIADACAAESDVRAHAVAVAQSMAALDRATLALHKALIHGSEAEFLGFRAPQPEALAPLA